MTCRNRNKILSISFLLDRNYVISVSSWNLELPICTLIKRISLTRIGRPPQPTINFTVMNSRYSWVNDIFTTCFANWLLIHYLFCEFTFNSPSVLQIHCEFTIFVANSLQTYYLFREFFSNIPWIHYLFCLFTMDPLGLYEIVFRIWTFLQLMISEMSIF